jgi:hypothetical protein
MVLADLGPASLAPWPAVVGLPMTAPRPSADHFVHAPRLTFDKQKLIPHRGLLHLNLAVTARDRNPSARAPHSISRSERPPKSQNWNLRRRYAVS